jgi:hypothetical protein
MSNSTYMCIHKGTLMFYFGVSFTSLDCPFYQVYRKQSLSKVLNLLGRTSHCAYNSSHRLDTFYIIFPSVRYGGDNVMLSQCCPRGVSVHKMQYIYHIILQHVTDPDLDPIFKVTCRLQLSLFDTFM